MLYFAQNEFEFRTAGPFQWVVTAIQGMGLGNTDGSWSQLFGSILWSILNKRTIAVFNHIEFNVNNVILRAKNYIVTDGDLREQVIGSVRAQIYSMQLVGRSFSPPRWAKFNADFLTALELAWNYGKEFRYQYLVTIKKQRKEYPHNLTCS